MSDAEKRADRYGIKIIYDNAGCLVCQKPAGIPTDGGSVSTVSLLSERMGREILPVHRLDTETSGVLVLAYKHDEAARLSALIRDRQGFEKEYLTVIEGCPAEKSGTLNDYLFFDRSKNKSFAVSKPRNGVKEASLDYEVLKTAVCGEDTLSLVKVRLHTGRTHQIRVQFASRGMPVAGDRRYGSHMKCPLALRSERISFPDRNGSMLSFENPGQFVHPFDLFEQ